MIEELKKYILDGEFEVCKKICNNITYQQLEDNIMLIALETDNISTYFFILHMLFEKESAELHSLASSLLSGVFTYIPGVYYNAYSHMLKAVQLSPNNYEYMEGLLLFYHIPDKIIDKNTALRIANEILNINPKSESAKSIIVDIQK